MAEDKLFHKIEIESGAVQTEQEASEKITRKREDLFRKHGQQNIADTVWSVVIPQGAENLKGEGKTYQEAYQKATSTITEGTQVATPAVSVTEHYELECGRYVAKASGKSKASLLEHLTRDVDAAKTRVGENFVDKEHGGLLSVSYTVTLYSGGWKGKAEKPLGKLLATATSNKSIEEAEALAKAKAGDATSKGKVYEGTEEYKVIIAGMSHKEISDLLGKDVAAAATPAVATDSSSRPSSRSSSKGSGACYIPQSTPVYDCV